MASNEQRLVALLTNAPRTLTVPYGDDEMEIELASPDQLDAMQLGYAVDDAGRSLVGPDRWQEQWRVIGYETLLGDPVFVDLSDDQLPVYTAMHDALSFGPQKLSPSLAGSLPDGQPRS